MTKRWLHGVLISSVLVATFSNVALAGDGNDTVFLRNGGRVRGLVMEESPDKGVSVKLADGSVKTYKATEVKNVEYAEPPPPPPAAPPPPPVAVTPPPPPPQAGVLVNVQSDDPQVTLDRITSEMAGGGTNGFYSVSVSGIEWSTVCTVPCEKRLDPNAKYRISGQGVQPSSSFALGGADGETTTLKVKAGSSAGRVWGVVLTSLGVATATVGATFLLANSAMASSSIDSDGSVSSPTLPGGVPMVVGGLIASVVGVVLIATNGTSVTTDSGRVLAAAPTPKPALQGAVFSF